MSTKLRTDWEKEWLVQFSDTLQLTPHVRNIFRARTLYSLTLREVGHDFMISPERVRQIEAQVLRQIERESHFRISINLYGRNQN